MSASASKKKRKLLQEQDGNQLTATKKKADSQQKQTRRSAIIFCSVLLLSVLAVILFVYFLHAPKYNTKKAVATVGNEKITVPVYDHFYAYTLDNSMYNYYASNYPGQKFSEIMLGEKSMQDLLVEQTNDNIEQVYNLYIAAKEAGYTLSKEGQAQLDEEITQLKETAKNSGFKNLNRYMTARYGEGCTEKTYREFRTVMLTVSEYYSKLTNEFTMTDEEVNAAYAKDPDAYDVVNYTYLTVKAPTAEDDKDGTDAETGEETEPAEGTETGEETEPAEGTESGEDTEPAEGTETGEETEPAEGTETGEDTEPAEDDWTKNATTKTSGKTSITSAISGDADTVKEIADWLFAKERKDGDEKVFGKEGGDTIQVRFNYRDTYDYAPVNAYVYTITKGTDVPKEGEKTVDEKIADLRAAIASGITADEFVKLSSDFGTAATARDLDKNQYPEEVNRFLFDSARKEGDSELFIVDDTCYVVRYVSTDEHTCRYNLVRNFSFQEMYNSLISKYPIQIVDSMMKYAYTDLTVNAN